VSYIVINLALNLFDFEVFDYLIYDTFVSSNVVILIIYTWLLVTRWNYVNEIIYFYLFTIMQGTHISTFVIWRFIMTKCGINVFVPLEVMLASCLFVTRFYLCYLNLFHFKVQCVGWCNVVLILWCMEAIETWIVFLLVSISRLDGSKVAKNLNDLGYS
jgi:hypothetical protein